MAPPTPRLWATPFLSLCLSIHTLSCDTTINRCLKPIHSKNMGSDFNVIFQEVGSKELTVSFYKIYTFTYILNIYFVTSSIQSLNLMFSRTSAIRQEWNMDAILPFSLHVLENKNVQVTCSYVIVWVIRLSFSSICRVLDCCARDYM